MNRHPSSRQEPPQQTGWYWVTGFPGDYERLLYWSGEGFSVGLTRQMWFKWRAA